MKKFAKIMHGFLSVCCVLCICGCDAAPAYNSALGFYLGTVITISGYADKEILEEAAALCGEYERVFSRTVEGSDVWRINHAEGSPVRVCDDTAELLAMALDICEKSGGALDITIAPASELWDFKSGEPQIPDMDRLARAAELVNYTRLKLEGGVVTLPAGMAIDLGAVAKGYIADRAAEYLRGRGVESAILNLGGNVVALGGKPDGSNFTIGVQKPFGQNSDILGACRLKGMSVVTSGIYERYFVEDDRLYHHILDTKTGYPVENELYSVTIISPTSTGGDALSTICFVLGSEDGMALIETLDGIECVYCLSDGTLLFSSGARKFWLDLDEL